MPKSDGVRRCVFAFLMPNESEGRIMNIVYRELASVEADLSCSAKSLYALSNSIEKHYRAVKLPKSDVGTRTLMIPDEKLKSVQRRIADRLLPLIEISPYATAYRIGGSTYLNAAPHVGKPMILKLDIKHFFDSIIYPLIKEKAFPADIYAENIRTLLAMLCNFKDSLPQGAPTSPAISNIILKDFDNTVGAFCAENRITYTRYCDDMTFSGDFDAESVITFVRAELRKRGFFLNDRKIAFIRDGRRQTVTGIVVNSRASVSSEYRRKIRQEMHFCQKYGVKSHIRQAKISADETQYVRRLLGRVCYVLSVSPDNAEFLKYKEWLTAELKTLLSASD